MVSYVLPSPYAFVPIMEVSRSSLLHAAVNGWRLAEHVRLLDENGSLATQLPELKALQGLEHNPIHHPEGGVWEHVLLCVEASESDEPVTNLAILFHDIGKGVTRSYGDDGRVHYYGHEAAGLPVFAGITERVGFTNKERRAIEFGMEMHMIGHKLDQLSGRKLLPLRSHPDWLTLFHVVKADEKVRMHLWDEPAFTARMQRVEELYVKAQAEQERESRLSALIDGRRIMEARPELAGKEVGRVKEAIRNEIVARDYLVAPEEIAAWILYGRQHRAASSACAVMTLRQRVGELRGRSAECDHEGQVKELQRGRDQVLFASIVAAHAPPVVTQGFGIKTRRPAGADSSGGVKDLRTM